MKSQTLNISLPSELVKAIDSRAEKEYRSRSEFIREAVRQKLKETNEWENIFTAGRKLGRKMGITTEAQATEAAVAAVREARNNSSQ